MAAWKTDIQLRKKTAVLPPYARLFSGRKRPFSAIILSQSYKITWRSRFVYKNSIWAQKILDQQDDNGLWGPFHALSEPSQKPISTEQALRRLEILGYTIHDTCIQKTVDYMHDCLLGKKEMPDRREVSHDWDLFTDLMLATWIRRFTKDDDAANKIADTWATLISEAFQSRVYSHADYQKAYKSMFSQPIRGDRFIDFVNFYQISMLSDCLLPEIASHFFDYILCHETGIYYLGYQKPLTQLPDNFASKETSRFIASIDMLAAYTSNRHKLHYVESWIHENKDAKGTWDFGSRSKDHIYLPLSDSWRRKDSRIQDSTYRIHKLLDKLNLSEQIEANKVN